MFDQEIRTPPGGRVEIGSPQLYSTPPDGRRVVVQGSCRSNGLRYVTSVTKLDASEYCCSRQSVGKENDKPKSAKRAALREGGGPAMVVWLVVGGVLVEVGGAARRG